MSESPEHSLAEDAAESLADAAKDPPALGASDTRVMSTVSWIFLGLGIVAALLFVQEPSIPRHPHLFLLGTTGLVGSAILRVLARLFRDRPLD